MPVENLFPVSKTIKQRYCQKLQPLKKFSNESKSSTIVSKENVQNTLLQGSFIPFRITYICC